MKRMRSPTTLPTGSPRRPTNSDDTKPREGRHDGLSRSHDGPSWAAPPARRALPPSAPEPSAALTLPTSPVALISRRRRRQSRADPEGDRGLPQGQAEARLAHHLHQGAGAGAAGQDQGAAGRGPRRHRPRADRHRRALGRHRPEALDRRAARHMPTALPKLDDIYLARRQADAGARARARASS